MSIWTYRCRAIGRTGCRKTGFCYGASCQKRVTGLHTGIQDSNSPARPIVASSNRIGKTNDVPAADIGRWNRNIFLYVQHIGRSGQEADNTSITIKSNNRKLIIGSDQIIIQSAQRGKKAILRLFNRGTLGELGCIRQISFRLKAGIQGNNQTQLAIFLRLCEQIAEATSLSQCSGLCWNGCSNYHE